MSGHSKWSTIKRQKGVADAKRSQIFTKLANAITVAARTGPDPDSNFKLRMAIDKARAVSMPKDNIERAIKRGLGSEAGGAGIEELTYEGYGPGGAAFLINVLTDNRNRASGNLRHLLERFGGRLAENGSVAWLFTVKGLIQVAVPSKNLEELELSLIEAGATDINETDGALLTTCPPDKLDSVKKVLINNGLTVDYSAVEPVANSPITIAAAETINKLDQLREALDNDDDVNDFYDNVA